MATTSLMKTKTSQLMRRSARLLRRELSVLKMHIAPRKHYTRDYYLGDCGGYHHFRSSKGTEFIEKFEIALQMVNVKENMNVLDIGCGRGEVTHYCTKLGANAVGIDYSKDAIAIAKESYPDSKFICENIMGHQPTEKFDIIFMLDFVEHISRSNLKVLLTKYYDSLSAKGKILIHTNHKAQEEMPHVPFHPEHINLMYAEEVGDILNTTGYTVRNMIIRPRNSKENSGGIYCLAEKRQAYLSGGSSRKILVSYEAALGDLLCLTPSLRELKSKYPKMHLAVKITHPEILYNNPNVDEIVFDIPSEKFRIARFVHKFDTVDLVQKLLRRKLVGTIFQCTNTCYDQVHNISWEDTPQRRSMHIVDAIACQIGLELEGTRKPEIYLTDYERRLVLNEFDLPKAGPKIAFSPHTHWPSKFWDEEKFKIVCHYLEKDMRAVILHLGGMNTPYTGIGYNLVGRTSIRQAAVILEACDMFLGVDNGLAHLACAVGTPSVVVFGPVLARKILHDANSIGVEAEVECKGCLHSTDRSRTPPRVCPKGTNECTRAIHPEKVIEACKTVLARRN